MHKIYQKVFNLLTNHLSIDELLEFHECMDGDAHDEFFTELIELCARHRPEEFIRDDLDDILVNISDIND